jgi:hypothetical protein
METSIELGEKLLGQALEHARQTKSSLSQVISEALQEKLGYQNLRPAKNGMPDSLASSNRTAGHSDDKLSLKVNPQIHPDVYSITGLAPSDLNEKAVYLEHLLNRHG